MNAAHGPDTHTLALASLGAMTATVAHEMRNLLGGIELYATLVAEQCAKEPNLQPLTGRLLDGVTRLRAVATNLLAVSRRPEPAIEHGAVDLVMLLGALAENTALALPGTGVELRTDITLAKAPVLGDGEQIRQALLNLVLNAVQAMPKGGVLTLSLRRRPGDRVGIAISDTGAGMDRATLRRAFEPFFTTRVRGTGIGLAVVREVAERHGARLAVTSRPGHGTTFTLTFALADAGDAAAREHAGEELAGGQLAGGQLVGGQHASERLVGRQHAGGQHASRQHAGGATQHLEQATHGSSRAGATRSKKATA